MKKIYYLFIAIFVLTNCSTIHEEPDGEGVDPTNVLVKVDFLFKDKDFESYSSTKNYNSKLLDSCDLRYIIEIYPPSGGIEPLKRSVITSSEQERDHSVQVNFNLNASSYLILAWVDYVKKGTTNDLFYHTETLKNINIAGPYSGNSLLKDAFMAKMNLDLTSFRGEYNGTTHVTMELIRPLSTFTIIATDMRDYLSETGKTLSTVSLPSFVHMNYHPAILTNYNLVDARYSRFSDGEYYQGEITNHTEESCIIAYDYILMNDEISNIEISFDIYNAENKLLNKINNLKIPLKRNAHTIVNLDCLVPKDGDGGIGINDGFEGNIDIILPD